MNQDEIIKKVLEITRDMKFGEIEISIKVKPEGWVTDKMLGRRVIEQNLTLIGHPKELFVSEFGHREL